MLASRASFRQNLPPVLMRSYVRPSSFVCYAKKGKKGKKGGGKKKGGSLLPSSPKIQPWQTTQVIMQHLLMVESYRRAAGAPLLENVEIEGIADTLYNAPFAILAHDRFREGVPDEESVFTYANKAALEAFEAENFSDFVGTLSSACVAGLDEATQQERESGLKGATSPPQPPPDTAASSPPSDDASVEGDSRQVGVGWNAPIVEVGGWRVGLKGRKIKIDSRLWNILSPTGEIVGQAAWFDSYELEDGTVYKIGSAGAVALPTEGDLQAAEEAVAVAGTAVRRLKEVEGKPNSDPSVQEAVAELLQCKERLAALQEAATDAAEEPVAASAS